MPAWRLYNALTVQCTVCRMVWIYIFEKLKVLTGRESEMLLKKYFNLNTFLINSKNWKVPILKNPRDSVLSRQVTSTYIQLWYSTGCLPRLSPPVVVFINVNLFTNIAHWYLTKIRNFSTYSLEKEINLEKKGGNTVHFCTYVYIELDALFGPEFVVGCRPVIAGPGKFCSASW